MKAITIVPVKEEPNHQELFENTFIRVYIAQMAPGQETQMHSHNLDTLYVALQGGKIQTYNHPLDEGCPNIILKKYPLAYKIRLLFAKLVKAPIPLVDGFSFFMPSGSKKVIHKAIASKENVKDMMLLGIEFKNPIVKN